MKVKVLKEILNTFGDEQEIVLQSDSGINWQLAKTNAQLMFSKATKKPVMRLTVK